MEKSSSKFGNKTNCKKAPNPGLFCVANCLCYTKIMEENNQPQPNVQPTPTTPPEPVPAPGPNSEREPVIAPEVILPGYKPPRDPKIMRVVAGGIIALVMVVGLSIFLTVLNKKTEPQNSDSSTPSSSTEKKDSTVSESEKQALVKNVFTEIRGILPSDSSKYTLQDVYDTTFPSFIGSGAKAAMPLEKSYGMVVTAKGDDAEQTITSLATDARAKIIKLGFTEYKDVVQGIDDSYGWINRDSKIVCTPIIDNITSLSLSCGHTSWLSAETIALGNALSEAFKIKEGEYPVYIDAKPSRIENSPYRPYQKITASMYGFAGLFYRPSSDASWVYFAGTQAAIPCEQYYADSGARHAFQGDVCTTATGELSKVSESN